MVDFNTVLGEIKERNLKSDLENLAHAHVQLTKHIDEARSILAEIEELAVKDSIPEGSVWKLYDRANKFSRR